MFKLKALSKYPHLSIIIIFFLLHLYKITAPVLDHHYIRQVVTLDVARNFVEEDASIFYPKMSWRYSHSGITGMEFPLYNYLVSLGLELREALIGNNKTQDNLKLLSPGSYTYIARLITLIFSCFGMLCFFLLLKNIQGPSPALYSLFALSCSMIWFYFSRNVQPDVPAVSLALCALYFFNRCISNKKLMFITLSATLFSLAGLMKPPALMLLFPALALALHKDKLSMLKNIYYYIFALIILLPLYFWLKHAVFLSKNYGLAYFFLGRSFLEGAEQVLNFKFLYIVIKRFFQEYTSWALAPFLIFGFYLLKKDKYKLFYIFWLFGFLVYAFKAGVHISIHDYYGLPIVPLLCAICGPALYKAIQAKNFFKYALILIAINVPIHMIQFYKLHKKHLLSAEKKLHNLIPYDSIVATDGGMGTVHLYHLHRKGWSENPEKFQNLSFIDNLKSQGVKYLILTEKINRMHMYQYYSNKIIFDDNNLLVIAL